MTLKKMVLVVVFQHYSLNGKNDYEVIVSCAPQGSHPKMRTSLLISLRLSPSHCTFANAPDRLQCLGTEKEGQEESSIYVLNFSDSERGPW